MRGTDAAASATGGKQQPPQQPPPRDPHATLKAAEALYGALRGAITPHGRFDRVAETIAELLSRSPKECARVLDLVTRRGTFWYPMAGRTLWSSGRLMTAVMVHITTVVAHITKRTPGIWST